MLTLLQDTLRLTLANPRAGARRIIDWQLSLATGWLALILVSVVSAILGYIAFGLSPAAADPAMAALFGSPMRTALVQVAVQATTAGLVWAVGRQFGGVGKLPDALVLTAWVEVPLILVQLFQLVALFVAPVAAELAGFMGLGLYAVLLTLFVAELHGFRSGFLVFLGILGVSLVAGFALVTLAAILMGGLPRV